MVAPLFAVGREILFLPYTWGTKGTSPPEGEPGLAYLDLLFGHFLTSLWIFIPVFHHWRRSDLNRGQGPVERAIVLAVFTGCAYWLVSALINTIELAWAPFGPAAYRAFRDLRVPVPIINCLKFAIAAGITLTLRYRDTLGIGARFGIRRT